MPRTLSRKTMGSARALYFVLIAQASIGFVPMSAYAQTPVAVPPPVTAPIPSPSIDPNAPSRPLPPSAPVGKPRPDVAARMSVQVRDAKGNLVPTDMDIPFLHPGRIFEGQHFRIVKGTSDTPISFDDPDSSVVAHAANAYYHLEVARKYLEETVKTNPELAELSLNITYPITIRVGMNVPFSETTHFVTNGTELANTSLTVPASNDEDRADGVKPWGNEIWFFDSVRHAVPSAALQVSRVLDQGQFKSLLFQQLSYSDVLKLGQELDQGIRPFWPAHLVGLATSLVVTEVFIPFLKFSTGFIKGHASVDTAMIPEVVYHEFGHLVFGSRLGFQKPTALVEGYPNYFAYRVSNRVVLADRAKEFMKGYVPKNGRSNEAYGLDTEYSFQAATGSFLYSVLYQLSQVFEEEADSILYGAVLEGLDRSSDIRYDFQSALSVSIAHRSKHPAGQKSHAIEILTAKGL